MNVLALFGPTASGKTAVAAAILERIPGVVISADSMQAYRGVPILTAQPREPTELVAIWDLEHEASVAEYQELAHAAIDGALARGLTPVVVGGSGLYLRAALADLELPPPPAEGAREQWERLYDDEGPEAAHALLADRDPQCREPRPSERPQAGRAGARAERSRRVAGARRGRAVERALPPSDAGVRARGTARGARPADRGAVPPRCSTEVPSTRSSARSASRLSTTAAQIIGLREIAELPADEAREAVVVRTKRLAAYQRKWMRRIPGLASVAADRPPDEIADEILALARSGQRLPAHGGAARR